MDISSLHKSISHISDDELYEKIRFIRSLRRQFPEVKVRTIKKKKGKKKEQITEDVINQNILKMSPAERAALLNKLLMIKQRKDDKK